MHSIFSTYAKPKRKPEDRGTNGLMDFLPEKASQKREMGMSIVPSMAGKRRFSGETWEPDARARVR